MERALVRRLTQATAMTGEVEEWIGVWIQKTRLGIGCIV